MKISDQLWQLSADKIHRPKFGRYEYLIQRRWCPQVGVDQALTPECPESIPPWELVSVAVQDNAVFLYWKRYKS